LGSLDPDLRAAIDRWLSQMGDGLLLGGPVGTGKSWAAAAIARERLSKNQGATFKRCAELYAALRDGYRLDLSEGTVLHDYFASRLLILDDLGAGALTDHERRFSLEILDRRLNACVPTVVTTNWTLDEIAQRIDDRIASRLAQFTLIKLSGPDLRISNSVRDGD